MISIPFSHAQHKLCNYNNSTVFKGKAIPNDTLQQSLDKTYPGLDALKANYLSKSLNISFGRKLKEGDNNHVNYLGAIYHGDNKATFRVYAPYAKEINLQITNKNHTIRYWEEKTPSDCKTVPMKKINDTIFEMDLENVKPGDLYRYEIIFQDNNKEKAYRKDPRSFCQPKDTLGWSAVYDQNEYKWTDEKWFKDLSSAKLRHKGTSDDYGAPQGVIMSEMHLGILGGYKKAKKEIDRLAEEKICNTVLVLPTGEFFGQYNIGYDESDKFAPESSRGKPDEFKDFVNYAHKKGINVILDVVPNHFGSIGTVVHDFGNAFDNENSTPWGAGLNFEKEGNEFMRNYMVDMLMNWLVNYHVDGLRMDATEKLFSDKTLKLISCEIRNHPETKDALLLPEHLDKTKKLVPPLKQEEILNPENVIAEAEKDPSKLNNLGFDIQYIYDFKNTLFALLSGWQVYDCGPSLKDLEKEFQQGYRFYQDLPDIPNPPAQANLVYVTAHDELNAFGGVRLIPKMLAIKLGLTKETALTDPDGLDKKPYRTSLELIKSYLKGDYKELNKAGITKTQFEKAYQQAKALNRLSLGTVFVHPGQKLLFMGDERGELAPFNYNAEIPDDAMYGGDDPKYKGKKLKDVLNEQKGYELGEAADKQSRLDQKEYTDPQLKQLTIKYVQQLKNIIDNNSCLQNSSFENLVTVSYEDQKTLQVHRYNEDGNEIIALMNFSDDDHKNMQLDKFPAGNWEEILNSNDVQYGGNNQCMNINKTINQSKSAVNIPKQTLIILKKKNV